jgi:hypothetical protein
MGSNTDLLTGRRALSLDGVQGRPAAISQQAPIYAVPHRPRIQFRQQPSTPHKHTFWQKAQLPIPLLAGAIGGFFANNLVLGLGLIAVYGLCAIISRITSRTTFTLAFLLLGGISLMLLAKPNTQLIRNFATYAFVLVVIGVVTLARESRLPKRMPRKYRR